MDKKTIGLVLPAYQEENGIDRALANIQRGIRQFPNIAFKLDIIDDGSTDRTYEEAQRLVDHYSLDGKVHKNEQNIGVVATSKIAHARMISLKPECIIKTDLDADFDQTVVLQSLVPLMDSSYDVIFGIRHREITEEMNPYEHARREDITSIMKREGVPQLDPASAGSQFYKTEALAKIMSHVAVVEYDKRWGLDLLVSLVAHELGLKVGIINMENSTYDPVRRPYAKVRAQYDAYTETIGRFVGKTPEELSPLFNT